MFKSAFDFFVTFTGFPVAKFMKWVWRIVYGICAFLGFFILYYALVLFNVFGLNTIEEGWRAGNLSDYSPSNRLFSFMPYKFGFFPTGEGYILLGDASSRNAKLNGHSISPSFFSTSLGLYKSSDSFNSLPIAAHYRKLDLTFFLGGLTDIRVDEFIKQEPVTMPVDCFGSHGLLSKKPGMMGGKIVEATDIGNPLLWKTHEVIIYTGGNEFHEMSVIDGHIFECAIMALKSGETMRLSYDDQAIRDPVTQLTTFNLVGIENQ